MRNIRAWMAAGLGCALLAACGADDPEVPGSGSPSGAPTTAGSFTAIVTFGDSLSDIGTYQWATSATGDGQAPYIGGKFTTNQSGTAGNIWVETLAADLGITTTLGEIGFAGTSYPCPAAVPQLGGDPALAATCTAYGQGGSRVTDPDGIGHDTGALTVPVTTQVANHLAHFQQFTAHDLVLVWAGSNDVFVQFEAFAAQAAQIQAQAAAGEFGADEANRRLFAAQTEAQAAVKQAAQDLTALVRDQILAKGAQYVAVINLPDSSKAPLGLGLAASPATAAAVPVLAGLVDTFNLWLRDGLTGQPVKIIDANAALAGIIANPAQYGFTNVSAPACDAARISAITGGQITDGSSLFCNATAGAPYNGLASGASATTWLFADSVHPTSGGHAVIGNYIEQQLHAFGWI